MSTVAPVLASAPNRPDAPYPGLRPFEKHERAILFGREQVIAEVIDRLAEHCLIVVHGGSGCGKSSLIRAGVLPQMERESAQHGLSWRTTVMRPGCTPLWNLAEALARLADRLGEADAPSLERVRSIRRTLNRGPLAFAALAKETDLGQHGDVCVLIDQFEELFRFVRVSGRDEAQTLVEVLRGLDQPPPGVHVILTMRSDHLGECGRYLGFAELVNRTQYLLPRMADADLLRAIREPAHLYRGEVTLDLALRLIQDCTAEADALPLVQHSLMRLWQQTSVSDQVGDQQTDVGDSALRFPPGGRARPTRVLDLPGYPGLRESLSSHADEALAELEAQGGDFPRVAEFVFRALTEVDHQGRAIRRPRTVAELTAETGADPEVLRRVLVPFRRPDASFIAPYGDKRLDDTDVVDISHEALIRGWKRIDNPATDKETGRPAGWRQREQEDGRLWCSLLLRAEESTLLSPDAVAEREEWLATLPQGTWPERYGGKRNLVQTLLTDSKAAADRLRVWRKWRMVGIGGIAFLCGVIAILFLVLWQNAERQKQIAERQKETIRTQEARLVAQLARAEIDRGDAVTGYLLARETLKDTDALDRPVVPEVHAALLHGLYSRRELRNLSGHEDAVSSAALSPQGEMVASGSWDGTVRLWDASGKELRVLRGHQGAVYSVAFSPKGDRVVSGSLDGTVRLWDAASGDEARVLRGHKDAVSSAVFSADGERVASASWDKTVRLWDAASGDVLHVLRGHQDGVSHVAFSPQDDSTLASASWDKTVRLWDADSERELLVLGGHEDKVESVAFSPDGRRLASASLDETVRLWDAETGRELLVLRGHEGEVWSVAFSSKGDRVASSSLDETVRLWDAETGRELLVLRGHEGGVGSVRFSDDDKKLVSASWDKTVRLWEVSDSPATSVWRAHEGRVNSVALSPKDGRTLATASSDGTVRLRDALSEEPPRVLNGHDGEITSVALSPDGSKLVSASLDRTVRLWDVASGKELRTLERYENRASSVAFSPTDGDMVASASWDGTVRLWDADSGRESRALPGHQGGVNSVAFSPRDRTKLASASWDKTVRLWDVDSGRELLVLRAHQDGVNSVAFSPDGSKLASTSMDKTVRLWDVASGKELRTLRGHQGMVSAAVFSPDGATLASASRDRTVRLWDVASGRELLVLRGHASSVNEVVFLRGGEALASASSDGTVRVWPVPPWLSPTPTNIRTLLGEIRSLPHQSLSPEQVKRFFPTPAADGT
jgi:WD40 repeat protein